MNPLISIIVPVYNHQTELMLSLVSLHKQNYRPLEVIIIDDGSVEKIKHSEVQTVLQDIPFILHHQENKGAPAARNKGFELSTGEYVIFWDADIIGDTQMIEKMYDALQKNPEASFAYSSFYFGSKKMPGQEFNMQALKEKNYITTTSLLRRSEFVPFDENLKRFQDWDLWLTLAEKNKTGIWIPEYLFTILPKGTMSTWLPSFAYKFPWKYLPFFKTQVKKYEEARKIILKKHS